MLPPKRFEVTNIPQVKYRTREYRDAHGKIQKRKEEYWGVRTVNVVQGGARFAHFFIDAIIITVLENLTGFAAGIPTIGITLDNGFSLSFITPLGFGIALLYYGLFEGTLGSTPGKMVFKRVVINKYAQPIDIGVGMLRSIIRCIPFEAFSCFSPRGWHDRLSETFVVSKDEMIALQLAIAEANQKADEFVMSQAGTAI